MRGLLLGVMLACAASSVDAAEPVEKGSEGLLRNATLSQPFTVFDQLLLALDQKAKEVTKYIRPVKNDFRQNTKLEDLVVGMVMYEKPLARTAIGFDIWVSGIDDPWRDVCTRHIKAIAGRLLLPNSKADAWESSARGFFWPLLGPRLASHDTQLENFKAFSDSIVIALTFYVKSEDGEKTKFIR